MKQIKGVFHVNSTEYETFNKNLKTAINNLQNDKQEVEVQYRTNSFKNGQLVFSALVLGRVEI